MKAVEMAPQLRALHALTEVLALVPSAHMAAHYHSEPHFQGIQYPFLASMGSRHKCIVLYI